MRRTQSAESRCFGVLDLKEDSKSLTSPGAKDKDSDALPKVLGDDPRYTSIVATIDCMAHPLVRNWCKMRGGGRVVASTALSLLCGQMFSDADPERKCTVQRSQQQRAVAGVEVWSNSNIIVFATRLRVVFTTRSRTYLEMRFQLVVSVLHWHPLDRLERTSG